MRKQIGTVIANVSETIAEQYDTMTAVVTAGGFARVEGYENKEGKVSSFTFNSLFSVRNNYQNRIKELKDMKFSTITFNRERLSKRFTDASLERFFKLSVEDMEKQFESCKEAMIETMQKSLDGEQDSVIAEGHARNSESCGFGRVYFVNEKGADGRMYPVLDRDGIPTVKSIKVNALVDYKRNYVVHEEGTVKKSNSGAKVIMDRIIEDNMKTRGFQNITLDDSKMVSLKIDGLVIES